MKIKEQKYNSIRSLLSVFPDIYLLYLTSSYHIALVFEHIFLESFTIATCLIVLQQLNQYGNKSIINIERF